MNGLIHNFPKSELRELFTSSLKVIAYYQHHSLTQPKDFMEKEFPEITPKLLLQCQCSGLALKCMTVM